MIKYDLNDRVAVVTGGAQGFGLAITERFIEAGAKVIIWDIDNNAAKEAIDKVKSKNLNYKFYRIAKEKNIEKIKFEIYKAQTSHPELKITNSGLLSAGISKTISLSSTQIM